MNYIMEQGKSLSYKWLFGTPFPYLQNTAAGRKRACPEQLTDKIHQEEKFVVVCSFFLFHTWQNDT